jgi:hypothetical protein
MQVKFLLSVFCFTFHSLKPIRPRTLNIEKTWNGINEFQMHTFLQLHKKLFSKLIMNWREPKRKYQMYVALETTVGRSKK